MLGRLFAYDFKALSRILIPLHLGVIAVGLVGSAAGFLGFATDAYAPSSFGALGDTVTGLCMLTVVISVLLLFCATVATFVIALVRFYRNLFTDEGYLTLTLPVAAWQQLLSKVLAGLLWMIIDATVVFCMLLLLSLTSDMTTAGQPLPLWMLGAAGGDFTLFDNGYPNALNILHGMFTSGVQMLLMLLMAYASFCAGAALSSRHRLAVGIALFMGAWTLYGFVQGFITVIMAVLFVDYFSLSLMVANGAMTLVQIAFIVASWFIAAWILKRKVNLP